MYDDDRFDNPAFSFHHVHHEGYINGKKANGTFSASPEQVQAFLRGANDDLLAAVEDTLDSVESSDRAGAGERRCTAGTYGRGRTFIADNSPFHVKLSLSTDATPSPLACPYERSGFRQEKCDVEAQRH